MSKKEARMKMLKEMKEKMKSKMGEDYKKKYGDKLSSVKVVAPEKKMPEALSLAEKLMKAKDNKSEYMDGGIKDSVYEGESDDYKKKLMQSYKDKMKSKK